MEIPEEMVNESMAATVKLLGQLKMMFADIKETLTRIEAKLK